MELISGFIIVKDGEKVIGKAIKSIKDVVDEIIVIDSGSNDDTVRIANQLGAKVIYNEWKGYVKQKQFGEDLCRHKWILNIDADEFLSQELQDEINFIFKSEIQDRYKAYRVKIVSLYPGEDEPRKRAPYNDPIRLYNKEYAGFKNINSDITTHDYVLLNSNLTEKYNLFTLHNIATHTSFTSIEHLISKSNFYSSEQAKDVINSGRKISKIRIGFEFFIWLFKCFFIRRYYVFGFYGFICSMVFSFRRFARLAKVYEHNLINGNHKKNGANDRS